MPTVTAHGRQVRNDWHEDGYQILIGPGRMFILAQKLPLASFVKSILFGSLTNLNEAIKRKIIPKCRVLAKVFLC